MKNIAVILFFVFSVSASAQIHFTRNISIPFSDNGSLQHASAGGLNYPMFSEIDLNDDNVNDLFVFDRSNNRTLTFINNGNSGTNCWDYAPQYADFFPVMSGWAFLYDYNCDSQPDLFTTSYTNNGIAQYRNDSQGGNVVFTLVDSSIDFFYNHPLHTNIIASSLLTPNFNDIDGDGDMDIIGLQLTCVGGFAYYKNMSMEHYGTCDSLSDYFLITNSWGQFTLRPGAYRSVAVGNWNVNCFQSNQEFSYELARRDDTYASIFTIDIDGDNDKDAIIGDSQANNSLLVVNGGNSTMATMVSQDTLFPSYDQPVRINSFATHSYVDADNDGVKDLIVTQREYENKKGVYYYRNTGTNSTPVFNFIIDNFLQGQMVDVGESATPVFFDYDSDGLLDIIIGNEFLTVSDTTYTTGLTLFRNTGSATVPEFEFITSDYAGINSLNLAGQIFPAFGDLDGDMDVDMIIGQDDGKINYFLNTAGAGMPAIFATPIYSYMNIDVGNAATPQLFDLNKDNKIDLVIGNKNGFLKYYENLGSAAIPFFSTTPTIDTLGDIRVNPVSVDGYAVPFLFDQGGATKLVVSSMQGDIYFYENIDGNLSGSFTVTDTILSAIGGRRYGYNLSVSGGDINNDSLVDLLVGFYSGGLQIYLQDNTTSLNNSANYYEKNVQVFPNPVSGDLIVHFRSDPESINYILYDLSGQIISADKLKGRYSSIDVSKISPGNYFLYLVFKDAVMTKKIVIQQ